VLPDPPARSGGRPQVADAALITAGIAAVVLGCAQAAPHGLGSAEVITPLAVAAVAITSVPPHPGQARGAAAGRRTAHAPGRIGAYVAMATAVVGSFGLFLLLTYHFQAVLDIAGTAAWRSCR